jgi:GNAT superfamily N-acetyltransferase
VRVGTHNWRTYRDVRLACLIESAPWFGTTYPQAARLSDDEWKTRATSPTLTFWLAMADDFPLGTAGLAIDGAGEAGTLIGMWVVPRVRGTGVAQALVEQVRAEAWRRGCLRLGLHVDAQNARAQGFYRRLGFDETGLLAGAAGERDEVVMADRAF